jgi:hypothetical protein
MTPITKDIEGCVAVLKKGTHLFKCYVTQVFEQDNAIQHRYTDWPSEFSDENGFSNKIQYMDITGYGLLHIERRVIPKVGPILKLTHQEAIEVINNSAAYRLLKHRQGQSLMNALGGINHSLYREITNTDADCFYDDKKIAAFWDRVI